MIGAKIRLLDVSSKGQYFCEKELEKKLQKNESVNCNSYEW